MKKCLLKALVLIAFALCLSGCGAAAPGNSAQGGETPAAGQQADGGPAAETDGGAKKQEADAGGLDKDKIDAMLDKDSASQNSEKEGAAGTAEEDGFDPAGLSYERRFLSGNKRLYYLEDDGSLRCLLTCSDENDENIVFVAGDAKSFYAMTNSTDLDHTLHYWTKDGKEGSIKPEKSKDAAISHAAVYKDRFYYDYYDGDEDGYIIYYYDMDNNKCVRDKEMEETDRYIGSHNGAEFSKMDYRSFIAYDLATAGQTYRMDSEGKTVYIFGEDGDEIGSFEPGAEMDSWEIFDGRYLFSKRREYDTKESRVYYYMHDLASDNDGIIWEGNSDEEGFGIADVRDDYLYYYLEELYADGSVKNRSYYREKLEDVKGGTVVSGEPLLSIPSFEGVINFCPSLRINSYDGFTVLGNRAYYLWFNEDDENGHRGDVVWQALNMEKAGFDDSLILTGCVEEHEPFSDYGYYVNDISARREKDIKYYTSSIHNFFFYDDIAHAEEMNKALKGIYDAAKENAVRGGDTAYNDFFGSEAAFDPNGDYIPTYSYDYNVGDIKKLSDNYLEITTSDYEFYGGAHGMPGMEHHLFDLRTGKLITIKDLFKGSEEVFRDIVVRYSLEDWKNAEEYKYYELYDPALEDDMRQTFSELVSLDMDIDFEENGINVPYQPYAVAPYAAGFVDVFIPYWVLGFDLK